VNRHTDIVTLLILVLVATVSGLGFFSLRLDRENQSMRSRKTLQAKAEELREKEFGKDHSLLFLLEPLHQGLLNPVKDPEVRNWIRSIRRMEGVRSAQTLPQSSSKSLILLIQVESPRDGRFFERIQQTVSKSRKSIPPGYRFFATGQASGELAISQAMDQERQHIIPILLMALLLLLLLVYRSLVLSLGILLSALSGILVLGGFQWLLGLQVDPISSLLPPVLLTVGVAGSVHFIEAFLGKRAEGLELGAATRKALWDLLWPSILTVSTTMAGFTGLLWSPIPAVRSFGLLACLGVALTVFLTFLLLPAYLRVFAKAPKLAQMRSSRGAWSHISSGLAVFLRNRKNLVLGGGGVLVLFFAWQWVGIQVDTHPLRILPPHHSFRLETQSIAKALGGIETFDLLLPAPEPPHGIGRLVSLQKEIQKEPLIATLIGGGERASSGLRRIRMLLKPSGTRARVDLFERIEKQAHSLGWSKAMTAGDPVIVAKDSNQLVRYQLTGMGFTLLFLCLAMGLGFRSLSLGILGLIPNVIPAILLYGGLAFVGRPLSVGSAMIGSVLLGLTVDDTIHFLYRYKRSRSFGSSPVISTARSFRVVGRALGITTLVQAFGFLVCIFGSLESSREFAILASLTMVMALVADLFLLPSVLLLQAKRKPSYEPSPV